ncbi:MAG: SUMF1/EgtB/PvdO family nonheme iron enzyme, partial [Pseudomonadota bacterium]
GYHDIAGLEEMATARIDAFGETEIAEFLKRWGQGLLQEKEGQIGKNYFTDLKTAIINSPPIRKLARNPVMLTCLCVVHWNERKLPEGKADLLAAVLRWLLNARKGIREDRGYTNTFTEECFKALALAMTDHPDGKQAIADLSWAAEQLSKPFEDIRGVENEDRVRREGRHFLEEEMLDSGIIEKFGAGQVRFWHLNFQEHFAALALVDRKDEEWWGIIEPKLFNRQWTEVIDHLAGCLAWTGLYRLNLLVEKVLETVKKGDLASIARAVGVLGRTLRILEAYDYQPPARLGWEKVRDQVMGIFTHEGALTVPVEQRISAAEALGQGGDHRIKPLDPVMMPIPAMTDVLLGKYPVTVVEYLRFIENRGYKEPKYWGEWWKIKEKQGWTEPGLWEDQVEYLNRPVTGVSWYEAVAYCTWLSDQTGLPFRLPKSDEWEKAATSPGGDYPWGDEEPNPELANFGENVGMPTPVGIYPAGAATGGHLDMAGNVWEWNWDLYDKDGLYRVIRGGSWNYDARYCRSGYRGSIEPDYRYGNVGFRLSRSLNP